MADSDVKGYLIGLSAIFADVANSQQGASLSGAEVNCPATFRSNGDL